MNTDYVDEVNREYYQIDRVVERYASDIELLPAETVLLKQLAPYIINQRVLDIGVGPGRTTHNLAPLSPYYVGIDYSQAMLGPCRKRYGDCALLLCDARRLSFRDGIFDAVLFLWNAIDDVNHEGRLRILAEIRRVLRPGGVFLFAGHNLDCYRKPAWVFGGFSHEGNWKELTRENLRRSIKYFTDIAHRVKMKKHEIHTSEYSIINDPAFGYRLLTHYMTGEQQVTQLVACGFTDVQVFDEDGRRLADGHSSKSPSLHYVARNPG